MFTTRRQRMSDLTRAQAPRYTCMQSIRRFHFFSQMENLTVVSTIYWPLIADNLSVVSILLSNVNSRRYFNAFLALYCRQSIHRFNFFLKWKI